ncbi:NACHT, LRR and PYD domains-containing protein 3-like isoform 2-T2 [Discoglossus pictus]
MGLTEKNREDYFYNFLGRNERAENIVHVIRENETLFAMCVVPIICWIVGTVMKPQVERGLNVAKTTTSIYWLYVKDLIKHHGRYSNPSLFSSMKKLCALAKDGIWKRKILFDEKDIEDHGLTVSETSIESTFLNVNISQDTDCYTTYSFVHLSVQEFFAALYYVLIESSDSSEDPSDEMMDLLQNSLDNYHLTLTVCFLFGFCSEKHEKEIEGCFGCKISMRMQSILETWLRRTIQLDNNNHFLDYLYETQEKDFVRRMMSHSKALSVDNTNYRVISYCLMNSPRCDHTINLSYREINSKSLEMLYPGLVKCCDIKLKGCGLTSSCCENLNNIITANRSLIKLNLSYNNLGDSGVKLLWDGLKHPDCTLQKLRLRLCDLTSSSCKDLHNIITTNRSLIKLNLSENTLSDSGVKLLSDGLKHPDCTLQELRSLIKLDLRGNKLGDSGVKLLCDGLKHPDCTIKELRLWRCDLTSSCCKDLHHVITANGSLIKLDLGNNKLGDSGVKSLCDGLKHPNCTLQDLRLYICQLTSACCKDLCDVMTTNRSLIKLDLTYNPLGDNGVKILCDGLKHQDCTLQELRLHHCNLTSLCCADLQDVITTNRSLIKLDLGYNNLGDSGAKLICDGLKHSNCTLQELRLWRCDLTSACAKDLHNVINSNRSLIKLDL